jgi:hypothetical protein
MQEAAPVLEHLRKALQEWDTTPIHFDGHDRQGAWNIFKLKYCVSGQERTA